MDIARKTSLTKLAVYAVAGMTVLVSMAIGGIIPNLGGHGTVSYGDAAPFMLVGGLVGLVLASPSVLAAKLLVGDGWFAKAYVYGWCILVAAIGLALGPLGILLIVIGLFVCFTRWEISVRSADMDTS